MNYECCVYLLSCLVFMLNTLHLNGIKIYGPGLNPVEIVMPARYFSLDFREGTKEIQTLPLKKDLSVSISGVNIDHRDCRIWVDKILDRKDGVFIIRYKVYEPCYSFKISVTYKGVAVGDSPYNFKGVVHPEECFCPQDIEKWLNSYQCLSNDYKQVIDDLKHFPSVNFTSFRKEALKAFDHPGSMSVCNYVVVKNKIYRNCYGQHVGFKKFMDTILLSLSRKVNLPDMELLVNLGDWPLMKKDAPKIFPIFSWCGSENTYDIVMPTYDLTQSTLECMGSVSLDMLSIQGNIEKRWNEKEVKAFWRGRDSSRERLKLIKIARQHPDLINASLTNFFFFRDQEELYGPSVKHISFFKFFDYKYQLNLDGTVAAYRFPYLLIGDSVVFKQESGYYEHFYRDLKEFEHYIPFKKDLSDLVDKIKWAKSHEEEAKTISANGRKYAEDNLLPHNVFCYYALLLHEWSKRIKSKITIRKNMELVPQPENDCVCQSKVERKTDEL